MLSERKVLVEGDEDEEVEKSYIAYAQQQYLSYGMKMCTSVSYSSSRNTEYRHLHA